jgi:hypothetical protein
MQRSLQGDQIGRIFAKWDIIFFGQFSKLTETAQIFGLLLFSEKNVYLFWQKMGTAAFWAIFSHSNLVTLLVNVFLRKPTLCRWHYFVTSCTLFASGAYVGKFGAKNCFTMSFLSMKFALPIIFICELGTDRMDIISSKVLRAKCLYQKVD